MLNALLYVLVFGFVAIVALGHVLLFTAIVFGKPKHSSESKFRRSLSLLHDIVTAF